MKKNSVKSILILFMTALIWGFGFVWQVKCTMNSVWFTGLRFIIGGTSLIPVILLFEKGKPDRRTWIRTIKWGVLAGFVLCMASALQMIGISMNHSSGKSGFITGIYMVLVPFAGAIIFRRRLKWNAIAGAFAALAGLFLISFSNGLEKLDMGDLVVLAGAVFWTFHILTLDSVPQDIPAIRLSMVQFYTTGVLASVWGLCAAGITAIAPDILAENFMSLFFCGVLSSGVAFTGQVIGQRGCEAGLASIIMCTESVFAAIGGALLLNEHLGWKGYLGCALVFAGIIIVQLKPKKSANTDLKEY